MRLILSFALVAALAGCGVPSKERFEPLSTCRLEQPIALGANSPVGITLAAVQFFGDFTTKAVKDSKPQELSFFPVSIGGTAQPTIVGFRVSPGTFGAGIPQTMGGSLADSEVDEEGLTHFYPFRRDISGGVREDGAKRTFITRLAEKTTDALSTKSIATSLRIIVESNSLVSFEANWPVTDREDWRDGEHQLPKLGAWEWPSHAGANETVCLKAASVKAR